MVRLVHFSEEPEFIPESIETVGGFGAGCFFYPAPEEDGELEMHRQAWVGRYESHWEAPEEAVETVQSFDAWEVGNPYPIVELFVAAENLSQVRRAKQ